nr:hypothetical protein [Tanacetum cinerariifolium]
CPVAVINVKRGNLILKEASVSQKNFAEKNANECTSVIFENKEKLRSEEEEFLSVAVSVVDLGEIFGRYLCDLTFAVGVGGGLRLCAGAHHYVFKFLA